jgi:hypothetical protein
MVVPTPTVQDVYSRLINAWLRLRPTRNEHEQFLELLGIFETAHRQEQKQLIKIYETITKALKKTSDDERAPDTYELDD